MNDRDRALTYEEAEKLALRAIHDADGRGMVGRGRNHLHQRVARAILSAARDEGRAEGLGGWKPIETAPSDTPVIVITAEGRIFKAIYKPGVAENEQGSCGAWCTVEETDPHPACWTDGMCWASNEDGVPSDAPAGWLPAPPASQTQEG